MIVTPSRRPSRTRTPRMRVLGPALVAVLTLIPVFSAPAVSAAVVNPAVAPVSAVTTDDASQLAFTLSPVGGGVLTPGEALSVSLALQNDTDVDTTAAEVTLSIGTAALPDRDALTAWLDGVGDGIETVPLGAATIAPVAAGDAGVQGLQIPADTPTLVALTPGVYPLLATSGELTSVSVIVVPGADAAGVAVVVPITAGPTTEGLLTADELTALTAPLGALTNQLEAVDGTAAIIGVDPAIVAAIRVLGSAAPASALEWLERLEGLENPTFALQFGDADASLPLAAGMSAPLAPFSLAAYGDAADFVVTTPTATPTATPTPTPTPTSTVAPVPTVPPVAELVAFDVDRTGVYWPAVSTTDASTLATLAALELDGDQPLSIVSSASLAGTVSSAHGSSGDADLLVYDADVSRALSDASLRDGTALRGASLAAAHGYLSFAAADANGSPILVGLDRSDTRSRVGLRAAITAVLTSPGSTALGLDAVLDAPAVAVTIDAPGATAEQVASASVMFADEGELARFATILDDPSLLTGPERAQLLHVLGVGWLDGPTEAPAPATTGSEATPTPEPETETGPQTWNEAVAAHRERTAGTLGSVTLLPTTTINLFGADAELRFTVRNALPYPANLVLYASPDSLLLDVQRSTSFVATAGANTSVEVPVQARVGSGEVSLALQLRSRASVAIGEPQTVPINVRAEWETFGLIALGIIVGGLLLFGIARTVRRRRRAKAAVDASASGEESS